MNLIILSHLRQLKHSHVLSGLLLSRVQQLICCLLTSIFPVQVEQARFLVPPFTLGQAVFDTSDIPAQQEQLPGTPEQSRGGTRSILAHLR